MGDWHHKLSTLGRIIPVKGGSGMKVGDWDLKFFAYSDNLWQVVAVEISSGARVETFFLA